MHIQQDSNDAARRWQIGLRATVAGLKNSPDSYALIPESEWLGRPYRSVHYFSHRIVYRVDPENGIVYVVRVYHGARRPLSGGELE